MTIPYSEAELATVADFNGRAQQEAQFWSSDEAVAVKARAKAYFIGLQRRRCCYCRSDFGTDRARVWDLEHVAPRSVYPHFMFIESNLAVSCIGCNEAKKDQDTLFRGRRLRRYPSDTARFKIVHPHYDKYSEHLVWGGGVVPFPRSEKGKETIYCCDLMRFALSAFDAAGSLADRRFESEVDIVMSAEPMERERLKAAAAIDTALLAARAPIPGDNAA